MAGLKSCGLVRRRLDRGERCGLRDLVEEEPVLPVDGEGRELGLLETLLQRAGRLVSKEQLVDHLCEWGDEVSNNAIEVYVHRLRKKLEPGGVRIATVRGLGYCLERLPEAHAARYAPVHAGKAN